MADTDCCLRVTIMEGHWILAAAEAAVDVTVSCRQGDLASLLMGSCELMAMVRLGAVQVNNMAKARELGHLLHCEKRPWLNSDY